MSHAAVPVSCPVMPGTHIESCPAQHPPRRGEVQVQGRRSQSECLMPCRNRKAAIQEQDHER